jgi:hypothetical protein
MPFNIAIDTRQTGPLVPYSTSDTSVLHGPDIPINVLALGRLRPQTFDGMPLQHAACSTPTA